MFKEDWMMLMGSETINKNEANRDSDESSSNERMTSKRVIMINISVH